MLDHRCLWSTENVSRPMSPGFRWHFTVCSALAVDLLSHQNDQSHPVFELVFLTIIVIAASGLAGRLFRGSRVARPRPPSIRAWGALMLMVCGPVALLGHGWGDRIELAGMALAGLGFAVKPARSFPPWCRHGA
jgi:hypothetical protein